MRSLKSVLIVLALILTLMPLRLAAHCDSMDGPVIAAARLALKTGEVTPVLKWIKPEAEPEIRAAFARTLKVRGQGAEARELADTYFFETLVRVHRAGEGEPYTGLKPSGAVVEAGIVEADRALDAGSIDALIKALTGDVAAGLRQRFARVLETRKHADSSVEGGRHYVEAYVEFIHYVERLHADAKGATGDHEMKAASLGHRD